MPAPIMRTGCWVEVGAVPLLEDGVWPFEKELSLARRRSWVSPGGGDIVEEKEVTGFCSMRRTAKSDKVELHYRR